MPERDRFYRYAAYYTIYILAVFVFLVALGTFGFSGLGDFFFFAAFQMIALLFALIASNLTGLLWPHARPKKEHRQVKQLYKPLSDWKAFPSDHTISAFILAFGLVFIGAHPLFLVLAFLIASFVGYSRIYAGLHYPRDILGGIAYAFVFTYLASLIFF